jgi:DNA-binding transcriptional LysR family regulator
MVTVIAGQQTLVDQPLSDLSLQRDVGLALPFFAPAVAALKGNDMILTIPRRLAVTMARTGGVRFMGAPREIPGFNYDLMWHPRLNDDPAHGWFRDQVRKLRRSMT